MKYPIPAPRPDNLVRTCEAIIEALDSIAARLDAMSRSSDVQGSLLDIERSLAALRKASMESDDNLDGRLTKVSERVAALEKVLTDTIHWANIALIAAGQPLIGQPGSPIQP